LARGPERRAFAAVVPGVFNRAKGTGMGNKQPKPSRPSDKDLHSNPLIGGSLGTTRAGASLDDIDDLRGDNTFEGDVDNDVNAAGGIDKSAARNGARRARR
jgi:hypothetical protein